MESQLLVHQKIVSDSEREKNELLEKVRKLEQMVRNRNPQEGLALLYLLGHTHCHTPCSCCMGRRM